MSGRGEERVAWACDLGMGDADSSLARVRAGDPGRLAWVSWNPGPMRGPCG